MISSRPPAREHRLLDLRDYLMILRRRKQWLIVPMLVVLVTALFWTSRQTPYYSSSSHVLVKSPIPPGSDVEATVNLETETQLAGSARVAQLVSRDLDLGSDYPLTALQRSVNVEVLAPESTTSPPEILVITYSDPDPVVARNRAQAFAKSYLDFRYQELVDNLEAQTQGIEGQLDALSTELETIEAEIAAGGSDGDTAALRAQADTLGAQLGILRQQQAQFTPPAPGQVGSIIQAAELSSQPFGRDFIRNGAIALFVGLALGVGAALLSERMDDSIRGRSDLEDVLGEQVLAVVPRVAEWNKIEEPFIATLEAPDSPAAEAYRTLRIAVSFAASQRGVKTLAVTSPEMGEGKSTTSANLAVAFASAGKRVILVSGDLRKPRLDDFFPMRGSHSGLTNVLVGEVGAQEALTRPFDVPNLKLMGSGPIPGNPAELLTSPALTRTLEELEPQADLIIIDSPPVLVVSDVLALARSVDGILLVVSASTSRSAVEQARMQLAQVHAKVIGAVLNSVDQSNFDAYTYHYGLYSSYSETASNGSGAREKRFFAARR